jgi:indole-3-glycerol phosphate synthase
MRDILQEIVARKRDEVAARKEVITPRFLYSQVEKLLESDERPHLSMRENLARSSSGIIAEFKRKSPSKGWIHADLRPEDVVPAYAAAGASAISILTDAFYFGGDQAFIQRVRPMVPCTPVLRKDFIIDEYQLFEACIIGADAVLLIAADLQKVECRSLLQTAHQLGLEVLLEIHDVHELDYVSPEVDMLGVNNRHLGSFHTDVQQSFRIAEQLPGDMILVSESGISDPKTVLELRAAGFRGFLIGETFMREADPGEALSNFIRQLQS